MALYDAFVSYSHAKDKPIAAALQSVIQKLGKPWYRRRSLRVFRDDTSLSATPSLWPSIEQALSQSRYLILLASPEAAASPWVGKEVSYWLDHKSSDTLLIALTDGELAWDNAVGDFVWREGMPLPPVLSAGHAQWQADLVISLVKVSSVSNAKQGRVLLREALAVAEKLERDNRLTAAQRGWPDDLRRRLAKLAPEQAEAQ